jgi:hypothetical protein
MAKPLYLQEVPLSTDILAELKLDPRATLIKTFEMLGLLTEADRENTRFLSSFNTRDVLRNISIVGNPIFCNHAVAPLLGSYIHRLFANRYDATRNNELQLLEITETPPGYLADTIAVPWLVAPARMILFADLFKNGPHRVTEYQRSLSNTVFPSEARNSAIQVELRNVAEMIQTVSPAKTS